MFFQIHRDGLAVDGGSYASLEQASAALEKAEQGGEVVEVETSDRVVRRYTLLESRKAAARFRKEVKQ